MLAAFAKCEVYSVQKMQPSDEKTQDEKERPFSNPIRFLPLDALEVTQDFVW